MMVTASKRVSAGGEVAGAKSGEIRVVAPGASRSA